MLSGRDYKRYSTAMKFAQDSTCDSRHGALIYRGGRVLGGAVNRYVKTYPVSCRYSGREVNCSLHAEQRALILSRADVTGATLYSARANGNRCSAPCAMCRELMREAGIKYVSIL